MCKVGKREQLIFWDKVRCFFGTIHFSAAPKSLSCSVKIEWATFACQLLWDFLSCSECQKQSMQCIVFTDQPHSLYSPYSFCPITPIQIHNIYSLYRLCFMFKLPETTCFQQAGWKAYGLSLFSHSQWPENLSHLRSSAKMSSFCSFALQFGRKGKWQEVQPILPFRYLWEKIVLWKTTKRSNILRNDRKYDKCCQLTFDFLNERTLSCELQLWPV